MTDFADYLTTIRGYTKFTDITVQTDTMLTGYVRNGEARINEELRIADMITISGAIPVSAGEIATPSGWLANDLLLVNGVEFVWRNRSDFYDTDKTPDKTKLYTTSGNHVIVDGDLYNGASAVMHYFGDIPAFSSANTWFSSRFPQLNTAATMLWASMGMIEDERGGEWEGIVSSTIKRLNDRYLQSQSWGTRLVKKINGFG